MTREVNWEGCKKRSSWGEEIFRIALEKNKEGSSIRYQWFQNFIRNWIGQNLIKRWQKLSFSWDRYEFFLKVKAKVFITLPINDILRFHASQTFETKSSFLDLKSDYQRYDFGQEVSKWTSWARVCAFPKDPRQSCRSVLWFTLILSKEIPIT